MKNKFYILLFLFIMVINFVHPFYSTEDEYFIENPFFSSDDEFDMLLLSYNHEKESRRDTEQGRGIAKKEQSTRAAKLEMQNSKSLVKSRFSIKFFLTFPTFFGIIKP